MLLSLFPGVFFFAELLNLDLCRRWMPWFGENLTAQLFTTLAFLVAVSLLLLFLAYFLPLLPLRLLPLLLTILLPAGLYCFGLKVCTQSYSDYMTTYMEGAEPVEEYVLTSDAEIYYPSFEAMGRYCFLQKESYSRESFSEGDVVYLLSSMVAARFREQEYIVVSDGEKAGLVSISSLERLDAPRYEYELRTTEERAPLYRPEQKDGEKVSRSVICTLEAGEKLEYLQSLDGYLKVCLADGTEGYVKRSCVEIVRVSA